MLERSIFEQVEKWNREEMPKRILDNSSEEESESDNESDKESIYSEQGYETVSMMDDDIDSMDNDKNEKVRMSL
jgi:hypothetical protein